MFSVTSIVASLVLAGVASANPVARAACNPALAGLGISIASGSLEIGYGSSVAGAAIISQTLSATGAEYIAEASTITNGGFVLKDVNQPNQAAGLFPTWVNGVIELETLVTPQDGTQGWGFVCSTCNDPSTVAEGGVVASSCTVVNGFTGQCLQIGSAAGSAVTIANCVSGSSAQSFAVYKA
ncbi:hypothetical protein DFH08DRAFT_1087437 [Mycena albidolilacea]|uniref:Uncharacterized protein n=1 Tax=Mycena albidolilacea TaxID=1033008 RepID=A0AAD6Z9C2_9AGAR|nr:hypothetical protein DFH08DRAFT_1087437 [Mycena albidolilacea]